MNVGSKTGQRDGESWAERSGVPFGRAGVLGQFHLRFARASAVNGLAVVPKGFLGEAFGVAGGLRTLGPCVAVAV